MNGMLYEDFAVGDRFVSAGRTVTETDVTLFAGLSGDYNPLHTDEDYAAQTVFGTRIAHGLLGLSLASGLVARLGIFDGTTVAFLGIEDWRFVGPVRPGDTIHVELEIEELRPTKDRSRGLVKRRMRLATTSGTVVQEGTFVLLVRRRQDSDDERNQQ